MMLKNKKGQSTLEYILLVAAVVAVLVTFLGPGGTFSTNLGNTLEKSTNDMLNMANRLSTSRPEYDPG